MLHEHVRVRRPFQDICGWLTYIILRLGHRREPVTALRLSRCQERAWWPMRSGQRIVSDEEEQVIGVPTAQVTSNMPVLGPSADPTPLRGLLIAVFVLLSLPRCRCTDLGKWNPNSRERVISKFYNFRKVPAPLWPTSVTLLQSSLLSQGALSPRQVKRSHLPIENLLRGSPWRQSQVFPRIKMLITLEQEYNSRVSIILNHT